MGVLVAEQNYQSGICPYEDFMDKHWKDNKISHPAGWEIFASPANAET